MRSAVDQAAAELRDEERTRCEVWTRVMGYHRPVSAWNPGKKSEQAERRYFMEPDRSASRV
jgi:anaerobic ribonucleoside-triphosphate reductase